MVKVKTPANARSVLKPNTADSATGGPVDVDCPREQETDAD